MRRKRLLITIIIVLMAVGFATVSTVLYLTGNTSIATNLRDFDVYFSNAILDEVNVSENAISNNGKEINFSTKELKRVGDMSVLEYSVENNSSQYDAVVKMNCQTSVSDYVIIENTLDEEVISAKEAKDGILYITLDQSSTTAIETNFSCELLVNAKERESAGVENKVEGVPETYSLTGFLVNDNNEVVPNATVVVYSETPHYGKTDGRGYLYITGLETGSHEIYYFNNKTIEQLQTLEKTEVVSTSTSNGSFTTSTKSTISLSNEYEIVQDLIKKSNNETLIVTLDANGGSVSDANKTVVENEEYGTLPTPTKTGYEFQGWYYGSEKIESSYLVQKEIGNHTLKAKWSTNGYTIYYDGNNATGNMNYVELSFDEEYTIPENGYTKTGYTFTGYNTAANGSGVTYKKGDKVSGLVSENNGSITLYAIWQANKYTVFFNALEGSTDVSQKEVTYDSTYGELPSATRSGYTFGGWYLDGVEIKSTSTVKITENKSLRARWIANEYTLTLDANGGSVTPSTKTVVYGMEIGELPTPVRTNYTFNGWFDGDTKVTNKTVVTKTSNYTVTASWSANNITCDSSGYTGVYDGNNHSINVTCETEGVTIEYSTDNKTYSTTKPSYKDAGTYTIYYKATKANYFEVTGSKTVTITAKDNTLSLSSYEENLTYPETKTVSVLENTGSGNITVTSSNTNIVKTSISNGVITLTSNTTEGDATVTVTSAATNNYKTKSTTIAVTVSKGTIDYSAEGYTGVYDGDSHGITVTSNISGSTITYSSDGTSYSATKPTYKDAGTYTTYFKITKPGYKDVTGSKTVTITKANNTLTLDTTTLELTYPATGTVNVSKNVSSGELSVTTSASTKATASISGNKVTVTSGTTAGSATITVTSAETTNYKSASATVVVTVKNGDIEVSASGYTGVYDGKAHNITVTSNVGTISYSTDNKTYSTTNPTKTDVGTYTIYYKVSASGYTTAEGSKQIVITKANNTLTLDATESSITIPNTKVINVTKNVSGGTITATSGDEELVSATISGNKITLTPHITSGTTTVVVTSAATTNYKEASVTINVTVEKGTIEYTNGNYTGNYDNNTHGITLNVTSPSGTTIKYGTSSGSYTLTTKPTYKDAGVYTTYYQITKDGYNTITGSNTVTINKISCSSLSIDKTSGSLKYPATDTITVSGACGDVSVASSNTNIAKVTYASGKVTVASNTTAGSSTITITSKESTNYKATSKTYAATVTLGDIEYTSSDTTVTYNGNAHSISVNVTKPTSGYTIKYSSDGTSYSTTQISKTNAGTYTIYYQISAPGYATVTGSKKVTINEAAKEYTKTNGSATYNGSAQTGGAKVNVTKPASGYTIKYGTSKGTYNQTSMPGCTNAGTCTVYFQISAANYKTIEDSLTITIAKANMNCTMTNGNATYNGSAQNGDLNVTCTTPVSPTITYSTDNSTFTSSKPTRTNAGTTTVYVKATATNYNDWTKTGSITINKADCSGFAIDKTSGTLTYPTSVSITASGACGTVSTSSSATSVATVSISGSVVTVAPAAVTTDGGKSTITVTSAESTNYKSASKTYTATVNRGTITYTSSNYSGTYDGNSHTIGLTVTNPSGTTITYSENGTSYSATKPTYVNAGEYTVYYKIEKAGYKPISESKTVTIDKKDNNITLSDTSGTVEEEETITFTVTNNESNGLLSVTSSDTSIATATINEDIVTVTGVSEGEATITVTSALTSNYNTKSVTYNITVESSGVYVPETVDFDYTGNIQTFTAPNAGYYTLETWGAQGGSTNASFIGGYGGYSKGTIYLNKNDVLYIVVGGKGSANYCSGWTLMNGGYNGGGSAYWNESYVGIASGGGATHIATKTGILSTLENDKDEILIVSGGGGAGYEITVSNNDGAGGSAGGYIGNSGFANNSAVITAKGGTQTAGGTGGIWNNTTGISGSFGQGGSYSDSSKPGASGGGGFYGGGSSSWGGGSGGSGYIGNTNLTDKVMYCYNCSESSVESTKTVSTTCKSSDPTENCAKQGDGYARIKYIKKIETAVEKKEFDYTGNIQTFTAPNGGYYTLETWGAQGGGTNGGYGGYSNGKILLNKNDILYIVVGGSGTSSGYNGGGTGSGTGGGATHISLSTGLISTTSAWNNLIIVSGGGGGGSTHAGGAGGGFTGGNGGSSNYVDNTGVAGLGGTQTGGGASSYATSDDWGGLYSNSGSAGTGGASKSAGNIGSTGAGGGGYYGGSGGLSNGYRSNSSGGGGSGYIGNSLLSDKVMYCYNCTESSDESTKTKSTTCSSSTPTANCSKQGNGYARITYEIK